MGRKGVCGKPRKGVLHLSNKKFLELFSSFKNLHGGAKIVFRHAELLQNEKFCNSSFLFFLRFSPNLMYALL